MPKQASAVVDDFNEEDAPDTFEGLCKTLKEENEGLNDNIIILKKQNEFLVKKLKKLQQITTVLLNNYESISLTTKHTKDMLNILEEKGVDEDE